MYLLTYFWSLVLFLSPPFSVEKYVTVLDHIFPKWESKFYVPLCRLH